MKTKYAVLGVLFLLSVITSVNAITYTALDYPGSDATWLKAVDGSNIVGWCHISGADIYYFLYNGTTWGLLNLPTGAGEITGLSGGNIVGRYSNVHDSFLYNWIDQTTVNFPDTAISGIDGSKIFGSANGHGYIYNIDNQTSTTFDFPGAVGTSIIDIDGDNIVGQYWDAINNYYNFFYDGTTYISLNLPGYIVGISGNKIVINSGVYDLDTQILTTLAFPGAIMTRPENIDGDTIVGVYAYGKHGFIATIPEPASAFLVIAGMGLFRLRREKNLKVNN
jgi:hypothetical protein